MSLRRPLRILFTNNTLAERAGSELFVFDLAVALRKRGHQPIAFSTVLGQVADLLRSAGIPVVDELSNITDTPDVIHGHHHLELASALLHFPETPAVNVCHGWLPWEEAPLLFPTIRKYVAVSKLTRKRLLDSGVHADMIEVIPNFVDTEKFSPRDRTIGTPKTAAVFSNYIGPYDRNFLEIVSACQRFGILKVDLYGQSARTPLSKPEEVLPQYDVIFAAGRCALEALACGCAVIVADHHGFGGLVTPRTMEELQLGNFGFAVTHGNTTTAEKVIVELEKIDPVEVKVVCDTIRARSSLSTAVLTWERIYLEAMERRPTSAPLTHAASAYLRKLNPVIKELRQERSAFQQRMADLTATLEQRTTELSKAQRTITVLERTIEEQNQQLATQNQQIITYQQQLAQIMSSISWRLTAPFRKLGRPVNRLRMSPFGVKLAAALRHPTNSRKRKLYRASRKDAQTRISAMEKKVAWEVPRADTYQRRLAEIMSSASWQLTSTFRKLSSSLARLRTSTFGVKLAAALRHPTNSGKRKTYRAKYTPRTMVPVLPAHISHSWRDDKRYLKYLSSRFVLGLKPFLPRRFAERMQRRMMKNKPSLASVSGQVSSYAAAPSRLPGSRVLIIDSCHPDDKRDSGSLDMLNYLRWFRSIGKAVDFVAIDRYEPDPQLEEPARQLGARIVNRACAPDFSAFLRENAGLYSILFLSRVHSGGRWLELARRANPKAAIIFSTVDLHHIREEREARLLGDLAGILSAAATRERELHIVRQADLTIVVSKKELEILTTEVPGAKIAVMPLYRPLPSQVRGFEQRFGIGFVGGFKHSPNVDAIRYFLSEVWPALRASAPQITLSVAGPSLPAEIVGALPEGVTYEGQVPDLEAWLSALRLTVAPLRYGAGAKGKVASSVANGVPVVGTSIAFEGMGLPQSCTFAADDPASMVQLILRLHADAELWRRASESCRAYAEAELSPEVGRQRFAQLVAEITDNLASP